MKLCNLTTSTFLYLTASVRARFFAGVNWC